MPDQDDNPFTRRLLPPLPPLPPPPSDGNGRDDENDSDGQSWGQIISAIILYATILVTGFIVTKEGGEKWWAVALAVMACHYYLSSIMINERELGAMFSFGRAIRDLKSGYYFVFWPLYYIRRATKNLVQIEIGVLTDDERKKAKKLEESASVFLMEDPLYVNWGDVKSAVTLTKSDTKPDSPTKKEEEDMFKGNPYGDAMVTDTHVTVRFRIFSLTKLIKKAGSLEEGIELIQKVATSTLVSHAGKSFVGRVIRDMEAMDEELRKAVEEFVVDPHSIAFNGLPGKPEDGRPNDSWGIDVEKTQITRLGTSKRINVAIADKGKVIYAAQGEKVKRQEEGIGTADAIKAKAEADRIRLTKEGVGNANAEKLLLIARKVGTESLAKLAGTPEGRLILQLQALQKGLEAGKTVILPMELMGLVSALGDKLIPSSPPALR